MMEARLLRVLVTAHNLQSTYKAKKLHIIAIIITRHSHRAY